MERDGDRRGDGEGGVGRRQGKPGPEGEPPRGQWKWWQLTVVRDFLEGRRGRGSTARRNPAVTHGRIELFIVMAGCSAHSLCVGVGRVRGPPVRGRILSLLLPLLSTIIPPPFSRSILSSRRWTLVSTNTDTGGASLSAPLYNTARSPSPSRSIYPPPTPFSSTVSSLAPVPSVLAAPLAPSFSRPLLSLLPVLSLVLTQGPSATCASGAAHSPAYTPLGVQHLPTWPRHNCIRARPTVDPVHTPRLPASIHRTKFIPPPLERLYYITSNV